jgi:hypothetical protein
MGNLQSFDDFFPGQGRKGLAFDKGKIFPSIAVVQY